jgi:hypothetical protein
MHQFPYHDAWDEEDDDAEQYERALRRKRTRARWIFAVLAGVAVITVTSGMILLGAGPRLAASLDRWEVEMWEPTLAETRRETAPPAAPVPPPPAEPAQPAVAPPPTPPPAEPAAAPEPPAAVLPPAQPAATPEPPPPTKQQAQPSAAKPEAPRATAPKRATAKPKAVTTATEPNRDLIHGGGVSWRKGAALPSATATGSPQAPEQAPSAQPPAAPAPKSDVYEER